MEKSKEIKKQILNFLNPNLIINICNDSYDDVIFDYCKLNDLDFNIITQNTKNPIFFEKYRKINYYKEFNLNEFYTFTKKDLIFIENDYNLSWVDFENIIESIYQKYSPVIILSNFFNNSSENYFPEKMDNIDNIRYQVNNENLENLFKFLESSNNNILFSINFNCDLCFLYLNSEYKKEIFDKIIYLNNIDYYELSVLKMNYEKFLEIFKLQKEISNLQVFNEKWIQRNEKLTKTKIDLLNDINLMTRELEDLNENISQLNNRNILLTKSKQDLFDEKNELIKEIEIKQELINENNKFIQDSKSEINNLNENINDLNSKVNILKRDIINLNDKNNSLNTEIYNLNSTISDLQNKLFDKQEQLHEKTQLISFFQNKLELQKISADYSNKNKFFKNFFSHFKYIYLLMSKPSEFKINYKLLNVLRTTDYFDIGYYLKKYPDIANGKFCMFFPPELHYVCYGFDENRKVNSQQQHLKNKKQLINIIRREKI